jgi:hypothetical protein
MGTDKTYVGREAATDFDSPAFKQVTYKGRNLTAFTWERPFSMSVFLLTWLGGYILLLFRADRMAKVGSGPV